MAAKKSTAAQWLDLVIERSAKLREAGVTTVEFDGCSVTLAPPEPTVDLGAMAAAPEHASDPMFDPATYPAGVVPGFKIDPSNDDGDAEGRA